MAKVDGKTTVTALALLSLLGVNINRNGPSVDVPAAAPVRRVVTENASPRPIHAGRSEFFEVFAEIKEEHSGHTFSYVLATVPDPDATALRLYTDRVLDMLMLAAFQHGFVLIQHWIPWSLSLERMDDEYAKRKDQVNYLRDRAKNPAILVFEKDCEILVMLLVPESPTSGIKRDVLTRAAAYLDAEGSRGPFVGPTFTGGLHGLDEWLATDAHAHAITRIVTGSVTGLREETHFPAYRERNFRWVCSQQRQTSARVAEFLAATRPARNGAPQIATLAEDSTGFGAGAGAEFSFPWQISRVRNAMPEAGRATTGTSPAFSLPFQLRDTRRPTNAVPTFAPEQTPPNLEVVLAQTIDQLEHERSRYVYVVATDVLDSIFLSRLIRTANPDQRILVIEPDLMFLRTEDQFPAVGLLAPATFPISNHLHLPGLPGKMFDSELSASIFEAAYDAIGYPLRDGFGRLVERPLWLMALGRNGFWPVAELGEGSGKPLPEPATFLWRASVVALALLSWIWCGLIFVRYPEVDIRPQWPGANDRAFALTLLHASIQVLVILVALPIWLPGSSLAGAEWTRIVFWSSLPIHAAAGVAIWSRLGFSPAGLALTVSPPLFVLGARIFAAGDPWLLRQFFALRSTDLLSGLSPMLPLAILAAAAVGVTWGAYQVAILRSERAIHLGLMDALPTDRIAAFNPWSLLAAMLLSLPFFAAFSRLIHSVEPAHYDLLFSALLCLLLTSTFYAMIQFVLSWRRARSFLDRLELDPLRHVLTLAAQDAGTAPAWEAHPRRRSFAYYRRIAEMEPLGELATDTRRFLDSSRQHGGGEHRARLEAQLAAAATRLAGEPGVTAREFAAVRIAQYLRAVFLIMRTRLTSATAGFVGITLSLNSYTFGPERMIQVFTLALLVSLGGIAILVLLDMNRNESLARMSNAEPGKLDLGIVSKIASAGALPVLSLVASYTPAFGKFAGAYLQPALELLAK